MEQKKVARSPADAELSACAPRRWVGENQLSHGSHFQLSETKKNIFSMHFSSFQSANSRVHVECVLFLSQRSLRCVLFIVTARVVLEGLWDSFALLVVTTKALLSAVALTWISKLLEFGLVKKSFPMVYFTTFSCFRWLWILNQRMLYITCWRSNVVQSQEADK